MGCVLEWTAARASLDILESHPLTWSPYLLLIKSSKRKSFSWGNLHSHFAIIIFFMSSLFLLPKHSPSLFKTTYYLTRWSLMSSLVIKLSNFKTTPLWILNRDKHIRKLPRWLAFKSICSLLKEKPVPTLQPFLNPRITVNLSPLERKVSFQIRNLFSTYSTTGYQKLASLGFSPRGSPKIFHRPRGNFTSPQEFSHFSTSIASKFPARST